VLPMKRKRRSVGTIPLLSLAWRNFYDIPPVRLAQVPPESVLEPSNRQAL